eukprot:gene7490-8763_t
MYYSKGSQIFVVGDGSYQVDFISPSCNQTINLVAHVQAIIPITQPLCQYSLVNTTFGYYKDISTYRVNLEQSSTSEYFLLTAGLSKVSVSPKSKPICIFYPNLEPINSGGVPNVTVTPVSCDKSVLGTITLANPQSYTSIKLGDLTNNSGIFVGLEAGTYELFLGSITCGDQLILVTVSYDIPTVSLVPIVSDKGCTTGMFQVIVSGDANPSFFLDQNSIITTSPVDLDSESRHTIKYSRGSCPAVNHEFYIPEVTSDTTYTFSGKPSCAGDTLVTLFSSHRDVLLLNNKPIPNGQFNASYGSDYEIQDTCTGFEYHVKLKRVTPTYLFDSTSDLTCLDTRDFIVTNAHLFSVLELRPQSNLSKIYTFDAHGVIKDLPVGPYRLDSLEIGCGELPATQTFINFYAKSLNPNLIQISSKVIEMSECNLGGKLNFTMSYNGTFVQQGTIQYTPMSEVALPTFNLCGPITYMVPNTYDYFRFPAQVPTINNLVLPCTQYDHQSSQVEILLKTDPASFPIASVSFNNGAKLSPSTSYHSDYSGNVNISVWRTGCPLPYQVVHNIPPTSDYVLSVDVKSQDASNCQAPSGSIQINNQGISNLVILDSDILAVNNKFTGLKSQYYTLRFDIQLETTQCLGSTHTVFVPTSEVSITAKELSDTCSRDKVVQLIVKDTNGQVIPVTGYVVGNESAPFGTATFNNASGTLETFTSYDPITAIIGTGSCSWTYNYSPKAPAHDQMSLFSLKWLTYPTCPDTANGVLRLVNNFNINIIINNVTDENNMYSIGNDIYGAMIYESNIGLDSKLLGLTTFWNHECSQFQEFTVDLTNTPIYPQPKYTIVNPTCGEVSGKVIIDAESLKEFDIKITDNYETLYPIKADGSVVLLATKSSYQMSYTNRLTGCTRLQYLSVYYYFDGVDGKPLVHGETCFGSRDATVSAPAATSTTQYHLSDAGYQTGDYNDYDGPSNYLNLPNAASSTGLFTGLFNNTYIMTMTNSLNPYCFSKQIVSVGLIQPTIVVPSIPDVCSTDILPSITSKLSESSLTNLTYSLDGGAIQKTGTFNNLQPGLHSLQIKVLDAQCHRSLAPFIFTVDNNVISASVDVSVCSQAKITATSGNATAVLTATLNGVTSPVISGSVTFSSVAAGTYTASLIDETGFLVVLRAQADCTAHQVYFNDFACQEYIRSDPTIIIDNFQDYSAIIVTPPAKSMYYSKGSQFFVVGDGPFKVDFISPSCNQTINLVAHVQAIVPIVEPLCQYSLVNTTFGNFDDVSSYMVNGVSYTNKEYFDLASGPSEVIVNSKTGKVCYFFPNLVPMNSGGMPKITVTPVSCDKSVLGTITLADARSYTSIKLGDLSNKTGIFVGLQPGTYELFLGSNFCGDQLILVTVPYDLPTITVNAVVSDKGCASYKFEVAISGDSTAKFYLDGSEDLTTSPVILGTESYHTIKYSRGSCPAVNHEFYIPEVTSDITHTFSGQPSCAGDTLVTLFSGHKEALHMNGNPIPNSQFNASYGTDYIIQDTCTGFEYHVNLKRMMPTYLFDYTSDLTCLDKRDFIVTNAHLFSVLELHSITNPSVILSFDANGVIKDVPIGPFRLDSIEIGCGELPATQTYINSYAKSLNPNLIQISTKVIEMSECNLGGKLNFTLSYNGTFVQQGTIQYIPYGVIPLPAVNFCPTFTYMVPNTYDYFKFPGRNLAIDLLDTPCTKYDNKPTQVEILFRDDPNPFPISGIQFNNSEFLQPNASNIYLTKYSGNVNISIWRTGCPLPEYIPIYIPPKNAYVLIVGATPQDASDCGTPSGSIQVLNKGVSNLVILDSDILAVNNKFTGLRSQYYTLRFDIQLETTQCLDSTYTVFVPTSEVSMTTKELSDTCGRDKVVQLIVKDTNGQVIPVTGYVVGNESAPFGTATFNNASGTLETFTSYDPVSAIVGSGSCSWTYNYSPKAPAYDPMSLFSLEWVTYPTCPDIANGVLRMVNNFSANAVINNATDNNFMYSIGDNIYGALIYQSMIGKSHENIRLGISWNNNCFQYKYFSLDLTNAPIYPQPKYTIVNPTCGEVNGKVIIDSASLTSFDIRITDNEGTVFPINEDGSVVLLASRSNYFMQSTNHLTGCTRKITFMVYYYLDGIDAFGQTVVRDETCFGARDATVSAPAATSTTQYHLSDAGYQTGQYDEYDGPSRFQNLPNAAADSGLFTGLFNNTYIMTMTNPLNPYCFSKQIVSVGLIQPTIVVPSIPDICSADILPSITAKLSESSLTNLTYSLDGGAIQKTGTFNNLQPGLHSLQVQVLDAQCHRSLVPFIFTVDKNIISASVDVSVCSQAKITATSGNATAVLTATLNGVTSPVISGSVTFSRVAAGTYTASLIDETGCITTKEVTITKFAERPEGIHFIAKGFPFFQDPIIEPKYFNVTFSYLAASNQSASAVKVPFNASVSCYSKRVLGKPTTFNPTFFVCQIPYSEICKTTNGLTLNSPYFQRLTVPFPLITNITRDGTTNSFLVEGYGITKTSIFIIPNATVEARYSLELFSVKIQLQVPFQNATIKMVNQLTDNTTFAFPVQFTIGSTINQVTLSTANGITSGVVSGSGFRNTTTVTFVNKDSGVLGADLSPSYADSEKIIFTVPPTITDTPTSIFMQTGNYAKESVCDTKGMTVEPTKISCAIPHLTIDSELTTEPTIHVKLTVNGVETEAKINNEYYTTPSPSPTMKPEATPELPINSNAPASSTIIIWGMFITTITTITSILL